MAKRKAKGPARRRSLLPPWLVLLGGLALGAGATLGWRGLSGTLETQAQAAPEPAPAPEAAPAIAPLPSTQFQFYTILPNQETLPPLPAPEPEPTPAKPQAPAAATDAPARLYYLQVGTFRSRADAERKERQVAALRYAVGIQAMVLQKDTWHRVRVGPFPDTAALQSARARLRAQGLETVPLLVRR